VLAAAKAKGGTPPQERSAGTGDSLGKLWLCASSLVHSCGAVTTSGSPGGPAPAVQPKKGFEEVWTTNLHGIVLMPGPLCHAVGNSSWCERQCVGIACRRGFETVCKLTTYTGRPRGGRRLHPLVTVPPPYRTPSHFQCRHSIFSGLACRHPA